MFYVPLIRGRQFLYIQEKGMVPAKGGYYQRSVISAAAAARALIRLSGGIGPQSE